MAKRKRETKLYGGNKMKISFLGVGNAFTTSDYWQSNILIESKSSEPRKRF